ncbi:MULTISPECIES: hypothetical protein [Streptomyces]|uniref:hypothetical protein n=1 Tax=Streptomyces TaxID=1883 RepID=UPI0015C61177|nr:hypothetical protein [Streptomyces sp. XY006]
MSSLLHLLVVTTAPSGRPSVIQEGETRTAAEAAAVECIREDGRRQAAHQNWLHVRVVMHPTVRPGSAVRP